MAERTSTVDPDQLPRHRQLYRAEGVAVYLSECWGRPCLIIDEGTLCDLLSEEDRAGSMPVMVIEFDDQQELVRYVRHRGWSV